MKILQIFLKLVDKFYRRFKRIFEIIIFMPIRRSFSISMVLVLSFMVINSPSSQGAVATQWFPTADSDLIYDLEHQYTHTNGSVGISTLFNVYNGSIVYFIPVFMETFISVSSSWISLENNTAVTIQHTYDESTSTQLSRKTTVKTTTKSYTDQTVGLISCQVVASYYDPVNASDGNTAKIDKTNFAKTLDHDFADYLDITAGPGEAVLSYTYVTMNSGDTIIAARTYDNFGIAYSRTYVADKNGLVSTYSYVYYRTGMDGTSSNFIYKSQSSSGSSGGAGLTTDILGSFTNNENWIALGTTALLGIIIGAVCCGKKRKK
jgi:hypothetical protein